MLHIYPNPVQEKLNIVIYSPQPGAVSLSVVNVVGRVISMQKVQLVRGNNQLLLNAYSLPQGIYFIRVEHAAGTHPATAKFIKQ